MDLKKPELSESELQILCAFIARKGFGEPALLLEILDHFACKVEELSAQHPSWPLEKRMEEAHRQFGVAGFYPLVKSYEESLGRRYSGYFRKSLLGVFQSARGIGLVILAPLLLYTLFLALTPHVHRFPALPPQRMIALFAFMGFAAAAIIYYRHFRKSKNAFMRAVQGTWYGGFFLPGWYILFILGQIQAPISVVIAMATLAMVWEQARYATFRKALEDYNEKVGGHFLQQAKPAG